jgi:hypothetical protein
MTVTSTGKSTSIIEFASTGGMQTMSSNDAIIIDLQSNQLPGWTYAKRRAVRCKHVVLKHLARCKQS